ncbi:MAG: cbb3-type cytochrome c oxidase subunit I, partial [Candidatus Hydrothermae bacterium]|nr:cbb3-type cytochrome c oxidase subunit I [Candidatus Hydrothermae bacterium]
MGFGGFWEEGGRGWRSWWLTLDHKRIGLMYLWTILTVFLVAGTAALLIRTELVAPGRTLMSAPTYNRMFSAHGILMVFAVIIPAIPAALGNFVLPLM